MPPRNPGPGDDLGYPDPSGRLVGEGAEDHLLDAEAPELAGHDGGVGHALARVDAGDEGGGARPVWNARERALREGAGEGSGGYALASSDAGELREELRAMDVLFVYRHAEG